MHMCVYIYIYIHTHMCAQFTYVLNKSRTCRSSLNNKWVNYEVRITFLARGMGMNFTAQLLLLQLYYAIIHTAMFHTKNCQTKNS